MVKKIDVTKFSNFMNPCRKTQIIIQPIMRGGIVPEEVQKKLFEEGWMRVGYAICYNCLEGRSDRISKPPVDDFLTNLADFFGGDFAEHTFASRAAQFAVMKTIADEISEDSKNFTDIVLTDPLCHYTTAVAAEMAGLKLIGVPHSGYPDYKVEPDSYIERVESIKKETGKLPALIAVTHVEPHYGNLNPVKEIGKIAREYDIPYMVNAAYTAGIFPVDMKDIQADFLTVSAHKSMASIGPLGFLITNDEWAKKVFKESLMKIDQPERILGKKMVNVFGCSVGGLPLISAIYSFPYVIERVKRWDEELKKARWFISEMEKLGDIFLIGDRPHNHHLMHFETPIFWEISKHHKRRGFFLADDMIKMGIVGLHRGLSKHFKISLYGLKWEEVKKVRDAFYYIAQKYVTEFKLNYEVPSNEELP
ncbi:MAG: O-phospho-L-seryl-tRNA:Cys-tRNA synthase [archaeon]|nr:O-phospho-L-seryl-tRNA:Cys-tRNA synthase [archaeon]MCP8305997.1 O-phospho-L-seryl-tRNA:Cys-tRNA synthase [archaeon]